MHGDDNGRFDRAKPRIDEWLRRLVDLSRRNRLLYHKPTKRQALELLEPGAQEIINVRSSGATISIYDRRNGGCRCD